MAPLNSYFPFFLIFLQFPTLIQSEGRVFARVGNDETTQKPNPELKKATNYASKLMFNLLKNYDSKKPSHKPIILYTYMVIDHLKDFVSF